MKITMAHGSGGRATNELVAKVFADRFNNDILNRMEDAAVIPALNRMAVTTDSFVVTPLVFKGGDIGKLAVCGTVNDLLMVGAVPKYITCGFIIEEGLEMELLEQIVTSMADIAKQAGVYVIAGDTKVIGGSGGLYINTTGIGELATDTFVSASNCHPGDAIILSGFLGEHHACILSSRLGIENDIQSDCAVLTEPVTALMNHGIQVRAMRDVTRGGLGTILNELAASSGCGAELEEENLPVSEEVRAFCGLLGLDPLYMGNEGKFVAVVAGKDAERAVSLLRDTKLGQNCAVIGRMVSGERVVMHTRIGGKRIVDVLTGEGLPRIC